LFTKEINTEITDKEADERAEKLESLLTKLKSGDELSEDEQSLLRSFLPTPEPGSTTLNKEPIIDHSIEPVNTHSDDTKPVKSHSVDKTAVILGQFERIKLKTKKE
jgi:hypothetical protein